VTNVWRRPLPRRLRLRARPAVRHPQEVPRTPPPRKRQPWAAGRTQTTRRPTTDSATCSRSTQGRGRPPQPRAIDTACKNDAALNPANGRAGEEWGIGIIQRTRSLLQRCTRRRGGSARADSRGWRGCPRAYTAIKTTYRIGFCIV
jgi:hypothetical protein